MESEKMKEKEASVMAMYGATQSGEFIGEASRINHLAWSLLAIVLGFVLWLLITLSNTENQRQALFSKVCQDRVFPVELDLKCLSQVRTRAHWWQHVGYALTHLQS